MFRISILLPIIVTVSTSAVFGQKAGVISIKDAQITVTEVNIPALETGVVSTFNVKAGEQVKVDQPLANLDDSRARLVLAEAKIDLAKAVDRAKNDVDVRAAQKAQQVTQAELQRVLEAVEKYKNAVSRTEIDRLRLSLDRATLAIEQAQSSRRTAGFDSDLMQNKVDAASLTVSRHMIRSSIDGIVVRLNHQRGEWVEKGSPVLTILRLDQLRCEARVPGSLVNRGMVGRVVNVTVTIPNRKPVTLKGRLAFVDPRANPQLKDVLIWAEFDNPDLTVHPGLDAEMQILPPEKLATRTTVGNAR